MYDDFLSGRLKYITLPIADFLFIGYVLLLLSNPQQQTTMSCKVKNVNYVFLLVVLINGALCSSIDILNSYKEPDILDSDSDLNRSHRLRKRAICPSNSECVPFSSCPMLSNLLSNECVLTEKLGDLSCGYQGSGLVCCPQVESSFGKVSAPGKFVDGVKCGQSQVEGESYNGIGAYPWIVRIGFRNVLTGEVKFPCTGSIINNKVILTAAHCALAKADNYKLFLVRVGEWMTNTEIDCGEEFCGLPTQDIPISHVVVHPGYQKQTYRHNIALLVLKNRINYTVTAQPICLPESWSVTGNNGILVGWGKTAGQTETPYQQQTLFLPITSLRQCEKIYGKSLPVTEDQVCAGGERGQDACSGFGGAPLLVKHSDTYFQVGILSFGSDQCGASGVPSVYTNIKRYVTWIRENSPKPI